MESSKSNGSLWLVWISLLIFASAYAGGKLFEARMKYEEAAYRQRKVERIEQVVWKLCPRCLRPRPDSGQPAPDVGQPSGSEAVEQ
jgi:hypothetical protein